MSYLKGSFYYNLAYENLQTQKKQIINVSFTHYEGTILQHHSDYSKTVGMDTSRESVFCADF